MGSISDDGSKNYIDKENLPSYIKFAKDILAYEDEETKKVEIEIKSIIIMKQDIEKI